MGEGIEEVSTKRYKPLFLLKETLILKLVKKNKKQIHEGDMKLY